MLIFDTCFPQGPRPPLPAYLANPRAFLDPVKGPRNPGDTPRGPKVNLVHLPGPPFGIPVALPHAPGTPSGPSKNRSKRKTEILKPAQFFHQKSSPGKLLPIQDPPKRAPLDPCHFPEGPLGNFWGAQRTSWDPPWPPLRICKTEFEKKTFFFEKR